MKKSFMLFLIMFIFVTKSFAFSDSNSYYWANDAINRWYTRGYISGYPDGTFGGNNYITRAEVISIINKLNNSQTEVSKRPSKDVSLGRWYYKDMGIATQDNLISVDMNGNLRPDDFATREEVAVIISKLFDISYSGSLENSKVKMFVDDEYIDSENYYRVAGIVEEGFFCGFPDNTLRPKKFVTRAEFICVLDNAVKGIYSSGKYKNKVINGNVVINGENVELINSEIKGKVFVLDGAKKSAPTLVNTMISRGINSRVGNVVIKDTHEYESLAEYNDAIKKPNEVVFSKLIYSEEGWTNENVNVEVKIGDKKYKPLTGNDEVIFDENGEKIVEFEHDGELVSVEVSVNNIDKKVPKVTAAEETDGVIVVNFDNDGLSPIVEISCSNGVIHKLNKETGIIENTFSVNKRGKYTVTVKDEAGNIGKKEVDVTNVIEQYTIKFDVNGGEGAPESQIKTEKQDLILSSVVPTREEHNFLGWDKNKDAAIPEYNAGVVFNLDADTTLYAIWEVKKYNVVGIVEPLDTGVIEGIGLNSYNSTVEIKAIPISGYMFKEWEVLDGDVVLLDGTADVTTFVMPNKEVTIKAKFEVSTN